MIDLKQIREWIEESLTNFDETHEYAIFSDVADFKKGYRPHRSNEFIHPVNGIIEPDAPNILAIKNLQVMTQDLTIHFVFDMDLLEKDDAGNYIEVDTLKGVLYNWASSINAIPIALTDSESVVFEVTPTITGLTDGLAIQISPVGDMLPVDLSLSFAIVEAGINSNNFNFYLNGENLFTTQVNVSRVREAETNMNSGKKSTKTSIQTNGISFSIKTPLLNTTQVKNVFKDILTGGQNYAQIFEVASGDFVDKEFYLMTFGNDDAGFEPAKNVGVSFDLVEVDPKIAKFGSEWESGQAIYDNVSEASVSIDFTNQKGICFIWVDKPNDIDFHIFTSEEKEAQSITYSRDDATSAIGFHYMLLTEA